MYADESRTTGRNGSIASIPSAIMYRAQAVLGEQRPVNVVLVDLSAQRVPLEHRIGEVRVLLAVSDEFLMSGTEIDSFPPGRRTRTHSRMTS